VVIIAEPSTLESAVYELDGIEDSIKFYENYIGLPYQWGFYKTVIIPFNMVYTGMENGLLTFQSHIIIGGDKSGMDNANHEITHSWAGNLVTCMNWNNFWLNEGIATFIESKMVLNRYGLETTK
jgi:leukotriene-A4 hydrolase